jgi:hypothetical protein
MALSMLRQKLKQGLPPEPAPTPEAPPAPPAKPDISPVAMAMMRQKLKEGLPSEPTQAPTPEPAAPQLPAFNPFALKMMQKSLKAGLPPTDAAQAPVAAAEAPVAAASVKISKVKGGEVTATDPYAEAGSFQPVPNDRKAYHGLTPEQIGDKVASARTELPEMNRMGLRNAVTQTHAARDAVSAALQQQLPQHAALLNELGSQLKEPGNSDIQYSRRAIKHYTDQMDPASSHVVRQRYQRERENLWPTTAEKRAAARKKAKAKKEA